MVRSLELVQYLSQGKLEKTQGQQDSNGCRVEHARNILCKPKHRNRFIEKSVVMKCKDTFTFCGDDYGNNNMNNSHLLDHQVVSVTRVHVPDIIS